MACNQENVNVHKKKDRKRRKVLNNLKPGWVAPDGGWGWVIAVASGLSNVSIVMIAVGFGLLFRERLHEYGISTSQITTIINVSSAVGSFAGLINGPLYKRYTFRQVACVSGFVCSGAICMLAFMKTFCGLLFFYSFLYGGGHSIIMTATALSLIPYFTKKRRIAVGLSWGFSGLGNILIPQLVALLMSLYGAFGAIIIFGGISLHSVVCAVLLQPVQMNAKRSTKYNNIKAVVEEHYELSTGTVINGSKIIVPMENVGNRDNYHHKIEERSCQPFGGQYPHNNGEENELETPLMTCTKQSRQNSGDSWRWKNTMDMNKGAQGEVTNTPRNTDDIENCGKNGYEIVHENDDKMAYQLEQSSPATFQEIEDQDQNKLSWWIHAFREVVAFFDLDLLRDYACVNIMIGVSLGYIIEINFLCLVPFILADYGLADSQIAIIMSIGGSIDVLTRLIVSAIATRIGWENRTFMFIGVGLSALGRVALAHAKSYTMILTVAIICAMGKGMYFIFSALVLPDHVSLEKLPAATGLQLMIRGLLFLAFAPTMGWLRQTYGSYTVPLYFLIIWAFYIILSGIIGKLFCFPKRHSPE